jgi:hypothetical protein
MKARGEIEFAAARSLAVPHHQEKSILLTCLVSAFHYAAGATSGCGEWIHLFAAEWLLDVIVRTFL